MAGSRERQAAADAAALAVLALLALAIRLCGLGRESLWVDEALSVKLARRPLVEVIAATSQDGHPPLYLTALHFWIGRFGAGETSVRGLSTLFALLALPAAYAVGRVLMGRRAGLMAALLLACSPYDVYYSQEARNYSLLVLTTLLSFLSFVRVDARERPTGALGAGYVGATALMIYTHVYGLLAWAAQNAYVLSKREDPPRSRRAGLRSWFLLQLVVLLLLVPWVWGPWTTTLVRQVGAQTTGLHVQRPVAWNLAVSFYQYAGSIVAFALLAPAAALQAYRGIRWAARRPLSGSDPVAAAREGQAAHLLVLWASLPHLVPFLVSQVSVPVYLTRSAIVSLPAFHLLAAGFFDRLRPVLRWGLVALVAAAALAAQRDYSRSISKEQWREVAAEIEASAAAGDLVAFDAGYGETGFDYYARRSDLRKAALSADVASAAGRDQMADLRRDTGRIWLVRFQRPGDHEAVRQAVGPAYQLIGFRHYVGIDVYLFAPTPAPGR